MLYTLAVKKKTQNSADDVEARDASAGGFARFEQIVAAIARVPKAEADAAEEADRRENPRIPRGPKPKAG